MSDGHGSLPAPPRYKMAVVSWLGAYPVLLVLNAWVAPPLASLPGFVRSGIIGALLITIMPYVVMPRMIWAFRAWLSARRPGDGYDARLGFSSGSR